MILLVTVIIIFSGLLAHRGGSLFWITNHPRLALLLTPLILVWWFFKNKQNQTNSLNKGFVFLITLTVMTGLAVDLNLVPFLFHQVFIVALALTSVSVLLSKFQKN